MSREKSGELCGLIHLVRPGRRFRIQWSCRLARAHGRLPMSAHPVRCVLIIIALTVAPSELDAQPLPDGAVARLGSTGGAASNQTAIVHLSADGIVSTGAEGTCRVVSPDGKLTAVGSDDHAVR